MGLLEKAKQLFSRNKAEADRPTKKPATVFPDLGDFLPAPDSNSKLGGGSGKRYRKARKKKNHAAYRSRRINRQRAK